MKKLYLGLLISLLLATVHAQNVQLEWANSVGGTMLDQGMSISIDTSGNTYVSGAYWGTADFDPGGATFNMTSNGLSDIFILKLDTGGNFIWAKSMGATGYDYGRSVTIDGSGNVLISGYYHDTVDFDPGAATFNLISNGDYDVFILKLDASGNFIWAKSVGGTLGDFSYCIATDASGNVLITGSFQDTVDFDPGAATFNMTSNGLSDIFILKLDANGNFIWAKSMGGTSSDLGQSITIDASGDALITGYYADTVDFDPGAGSFNLISNGSNDVFVQRLDAGGNFNWAKSMGGTSSDIGQSITLDATGNVYLTGNFRDTADFDPGAGIFNLISNGVADVFIEKLDATGNFIWAKSLGGSLNDFVYSIATDTAEDVYITGTFHDTVDFDPGAATFNLTSNGAEDIFIKKLYASGNFAWAKSMGGTGFDRGQSIIIDSLGNVYVTGTDQDTADFISGKGVFNLISNGGIDVFIERLSPCVPSTGIDSITACDSLIWIDGNTYTSDNNSAMDTLTNVDGCDSVVTLNLTITNSNTGTDVITACDSYTWIDGNTYTTSNNTATDTLTNVNGCDSIVTLDLTINTVDISVTTNDPTIMANAIGASYQWLDCDSNYAMINGETAQSFTASKNGSYAVEVTENGCTDTSACITISTLGIEENTLFDGVSIFPNPYKQQVNIDLGRLKEVNVKIFNVDGQLIYQLENITSSNNQFEFNAPSGVYFVEVIAQGAREYFKLVKI